MSALITLIASAPQSAVGLGADDRMRWSARRTVAFLVVVCGAFWLTAAGLVTLLIRAF